MNVRDYVEHLKTKPHHHRQAIAFGSALCITLLVGVGWLTSLVSSGVLAFDRSSDDTGFASATRNFQTQTANLAGAAASFGDAFASGDITVVDTKASSTLDTKDSDEATVIPF